MISSSWFTWEDGLRKMWIGVKKDVDRGKMKKMWTGVQQKIKCGGGGLFHSVPPRIKNGIAHSS